jgi:chemotaxis signal transduction protein
MPEAASSARDGASAVLFWLGGECCAVLADRVTRVVSAPPINRLPLLPQEVPGVVALGGKVVPVLNLRRILGLPAAFDGGELILATIGTQAFALPVDRVVQIGVDSWTKESRWRGAPVRLLHIEEMLERFLPNEATAILASVAMAQSLPVQQTPALRTHSAALVVETASSRDLLPLDCVVELSETLPTVSIPEPGTIFCGAAFHRGALLPLVSLDALLGRPDMSAGGPFVVVDVDGRRCALGVKRVVGLSTNAANVIALRPLLLSLLPEPRATMAPIAQLLQAGGGARYLLVDFAGRTCALALNSVAHIHAGCRVLRAPTGAGSKVVGVTAIGGLVLPVLDLGALLGLPPQAQMQQFVELKSPQAGTFVVGIDRIIGIISIGEDALVRSAEGSAIGSVARLDGKLIWILEPSFVAEHGGANAA